MTLGDSSYQTRSQTVEEDGALHKEDVVMGALCAAIILDLRVRSTKQFSREKNSLSTCTRPMTIQSAES